MLVDVNQEEAVRSEATFGAPPPPGDAAQREAPAATTATFRPSAPSSPADPHPIILCVETQQRMRGGSGESIKEEAANMKLPFVVWWKQQAVNSKQNIT